MLKTSKTLKEILESETALKRFLKKHLRKLQITTNRFSSIKSFSCFEKLFRGMFHIIDVIHKNTLSKSKKTF